MAGLFKKNPKLKPNAADHIKKRNNFEEREAKIYEDVYVDIERGIENLRKQPAKGILKPPSEPLPDYDSGYDSDKSNKSKTAEPFIPAPDYDLDEGKSRARDNWNKLINKFKRAVIPEQYESGKLTEALADSVQVKITQQENYLREIGQGKHVHGSAEFNMLRMDSEQLKTCKLSYDKSRQALFDHTGKHASTIGKESKGVPHLQAFVMSKEGEIYIASHKGVYETNRKIPNLSHASFLEGRPAEAAGMILIKDGKIGYISDNSGHYQPEAIDMYRGIKKIQEKMPGALDKDCLIHLYGEEPMRVNDFVAKMEIRVRGAGGKTRYEQLREERIAKIKLYQAELKNVSKKDPVTQATRIGKDLKNTLLQRKQDNKQAARDLAANARKAKRAEFNR